MSTLVFPSPTHRKRGGSPSYASQSKKKATERGIKCFSVLVLAKLEELLLMIYKMEQPQQQNQLVDQNSGSLSFSNQMSKEDEEMSRSALSNFKAKEEEIERKKMEVREKVQAQLGRVEEETKRLALIREELEALADPMRKDVALVRKKIDSVNKELRPLGHAVQKKEKEYKEALSAYDEKNKEKVQLTNKLMELVNESERLRLKKLEELSKHIDSIH